MALVGIELETIVSEPDALTTRPPPCADLPTFTEQYIFQSLSHHLAGKLKALTQRALKCLKHYWDLRNIKKNCYRALTDTSSAFQVKQSLFLTKHSWKEQQKTSTVSIF